MHHLRFLPCLLAGLLSLPAFAQPQEMDKELASLADKLGAVVRENNKKKVTVLDFTDLQGSPQGELGRYIAEELTVNLVMNKKDFAVLDRANLNKILAEHKLTATGLVDPENAKKLGQFAGVDALILGTIIPKNGNISLTAKLITTDTAEVAGAARAEFNNDETVQQLVSKPAVEGKGDETVSDKPKPKPFGDLKVSVESFRLSSGWGPYSLGTLTLVITNMSSSETYGVGLQKGFRNNFSFSNSRGEAFEVTEVTGIGTVFESFNGLSGQLTDIPPKSSIVLVAKSQAALEGKAGDYRPYRMSTVVYYGTEDQGRYPEVKKYNLVLDVR
jgi:TolB-like protein